jgi:hypothetical protein
MPLWINAIGTASIGCVYGYVLLYVIKRYLPPVAAQSPALKDLVLFLTSLSIGGVIGASITSIEGINYVGPYGIGLLLGFVANISVTFAVNRSTR